MIVGIEMVGCRERRERFPGTWGIGKRICEASADWGVWIRPLGDTVVLMPPLSITGEELDLLTAAVRDGVERVTASLALGSPASPV
jgi:adenosylmethionine-8-amino-7-oxononanoate aminotransferase